MFMTTISTGKGAYPKIPKTLPNTVTTTCTFINHTIQSHLQVTKPTSVQQ